MEGLGSHTTDAAGRRTLEMCNTLGLTQLGSSNLVMKDELEILGVTIDSKLTWTKHVFNIASRAGQKLGALRRVAHKLDRRGRATVYKAQV